MEFQEAIPDIYDLAESPELIKDEEFKHAGQQAGLDVYHKLLKHWSTSRRYRFESK